MSIVIKKCWINVCFAIVNWWCAWYFTLFQVPEAAGHIDALNREADPVWTFFIGAVATHPVLDGQRLVDLLTEPCQRAIRYHTETKAMLEAATSGEPTQVGKLFLYSINLLIFCICSK